MSKLARATPQLAVANVEEAQRYYRDVLGFHIDWTWGENDYGSVSRDNTTLFLCRADGPISRCDILIMTGEVDALCTEWRSRGAKITSEPADKPWGLREFSMEDNNGHRFRLGEGSKVSRHVPQDPVGVKFIHRVPALGEYKEIIDAVGWTSFNNLDAAAKSLPQSLFGVVAEVDGKAVGMARVIGDGAQFYYIMDVAVKPEMQGRGIGTGLLNEVVDFFQGKAQDHALVGLFTGAGLISFYERFGFLSPEIGLRGMAAKKLRRSDQPPEA